MKKVLLFILSVLLVFCAVACSSTPDSGSKDKETTKLELNLSSISLTVGSFKQLNAECSDKKAEIVWTSSNEEVATVDNGYVSALSKGTCVITASADGVSATCNVEVKGSDFIPVLTLSESSLPIIVGNSFEVKAELIYGTEPQSVTLDWSSDDPSIATVENGKIVGVKKGETVIRVSVTFNGEFYSNELTVTVKNNIAFYLEQTNISLAKKVINDGDVNTATLTYIAKSNNVDFDGGEFVWSSEDDSIATVENGVVTAVDSGDVKIMLTCNYDGEEYQAYSNVTVYKSQIDEIKSTSDIEIKSDDTMTVSLEEIGYDGTNGEEVKVFVDDKTFVGVINDGYAVITTDGTIFGAKSYSLEVVDRIFTVNTNVIAKTVTFEVDYYLLNDDGMFIKNGETSVESLKLDADFVSYYSVKDGNLLNTKKTGDISVKADGSSKISLYYVPTIAFNGLDNAVLKFDSNKDGVSSVEIIENAKAPDETDCNKITFTHEGQSYGFTVAGLSKDRVEDNSIKSISMDLYFTQDFVGTDLFLQATYFTDVVDYFSTNTVRFNSDNLASNKLFMLFDADGKRVYEINGEGWYKVVINLYRYGRVIADNTSGNIAFSMYLGEKTSVNVPFYMKNLTLNDNVYSVTDKGETKQIVYYSVGSKANCRLTSIPLFDENITASDILDNGYQKLSLKIKASEGFDASSIYVYTVYKNDIGTTSSHEIRLNSGNIGTGTGTPSSLFHIYNENGERIYDVPTPGEWFTLEIALYRNEFLLTETDGAIDLYLFVGADSSLGETFEIKDVELSKDSNAFIKTNEDDVTSYVYEQMAKKAGGSFRVANVSLNDITSNGYKKVTMKIKAGEGFDASTIFVYAIYNNDIGTTSPHEIRLNSGNIGSGTTAAIFRMYTEAGERIYDVPSAGEWFTLEIAFYRNGYTVTESNGTADIFMYVGNGATVNKPFYIKDVRFTTDTILFHRDTADGVMTVNYQGTGSKESNSFKVANVSVSDITSNSYQKVTMKIKASEGFDASTIFVYAKYNNDIGGVSDPEIRLNSGNISSGVAETLFRMYNESGERIYNVPTAGEWFTLEISFYRYGYLITESNGTADIYMYVGNGATLNKPFQIKDIAFSIEAM